MHVLLVEECVDLAAGGEVRPLPLDAAGVRTGEPEPRRVALLVRVPWRGFTRPEEVQTSIQMNSDITWSHSSLYYLHVLVNTPLLYISLTSGSP